MTDHVENLVIGAGVVGLAITHRLACDGAEVLCVDQALDIGTETSARNSEVIHAGIYYPTGSLKARFCVEGRKLLYAFCRERGIAAPAIGKLIVATSEADKSKLRQLKETATANGVNDLQWLDQPEALALEPEIACVAALLSPSTGIVDSRGFMLALQGEAEAHGAMIALRTRFLSARREGAAYRVTLESEGGETTEMTCRNIVNAAGHGAHAVAEAIEGVAADRLPPRFIAKGNYCSVSGRSPFRRLIYPIPVPGALGTHVTLDLQGAIRLGPDIEWVDKHDYIVNPYIGPAFKAACRGFWPGVESREVTPSYCGLRPKIHGPGQAFADFRIDGPAEHGLAGLVNLFGIESPGLTSSLAIAHHVAELTAR